MSSSSRAEYVVQLTAMSRVSAAGCWCCLTSRSSGGRLQLTRQPLLLLDDDDVGARSSASSRSSTLQTTRRDVADTDPVRGCVEPTSEQDVHCGDVDVAGVGHCGDVDV